MPIDSTTRQQLRERANFCCEYCHSPEAISASRFTIEHVIPRSVGGSDALENLALACRRCNQRRYNFLAGFDAETQAVIPLFNPRQQSWGDHFLWSADGTIIFGTTPTGRATSNRLDLNDDRYPEADSIRATRCLWVAAGWHPPADDPREVLE